MSTLLAQPQTTTSAWAAGLLVGDAVTINLDVQLASAQVGELFNEVQSTVADIAFGRENP